jgi:hypothetical protein
LKDSKSSNTELDCLVKFWSEIIESLFPDNKDRIYCKWGESKAFHNGFKIDCRFIIKKEEDEIDVMDVEAARYSYQQKSNDDHLKLCIESKDIVDYVATYSTTFSTKKVLVFMLQEATKRRPILDCRKLNQFIQLEHFKMEGVPALRDIIEKEDFIVKLDLKDAYTVVPIYPSSRRF